MEMTEARNYTKKQQYVHHVVFTLVVGDREPVESLSEFIDTGTFNRPPTWYMWRILQEFDCDQE